MTGSVLADGGEAVQERKERCGEGCLELLLETRQGALASGLVAPPLLGKTRLLIVRHGETVWNAEGRMQGQLDILLNDKGHLQAKQVAEVFERLGIVTEVDAIVSSDLSRASQTADVIAAACPGVKRGTYAGLREVHFGILQGKLIEEGKAVRTEVQAAWLRGDFERSVEGGESVAQVMQRGLDALRAAAMLGSTVVVVAHGGLIKWCAVGIELFGGEPRPAASPQAMAAGRVQEVLAAHVGNCCCSTVHFDHATSRFSAARWFEPLAGVTLDDSG